MSTEDGFGSSLNSGLTTLPKYPNLAIVKPYPKSWITAVKDNHNVGPVRSLGSGPSNPGAYFKNRQKPGHNNQPECDKSRQANRGCLYHKKCRQRHS